MKIAIIKNRDVTSYDGYETKIADSITDWHEVTEEEYKTLQWWLKRTYPTYCLIVERVHNSIIPQLIVDCLKEATKAEKPKMVATLRMTLRTKFNFILFTTR